MHWREEQPVAQRHEVHFGRVVRCFAERPRSVHEMFAASAATHPGIPALIGEEGTVSYAELEARTARIAGGLAAAGIRPGDRVGILIGNRFAFVEAWLACARIGAVAGGIL